MRLTSSQIWVLVGLASLIWLALSIFGVTSGGGISVAFSLVDIIPALLFLGSIHERWLWRLSLFHRLRVITTPVVIGTWRGELESFWQNPETHQRPSVKTVYLTVRQTVMSVSVRLLTDESASDSLGSSIAKTEAGYPAISYTYRNEPDLRYRKDNVSPIHYGAAIIEIQGDPARGLKMRYWTDRNSDGEIRFAAHSPVIAQDFAEAAALTYGSAKPVGVFDGLRDFLGRGK